MNQRILTQFIAVLLLYPAAFCLPQITDGLVADYTFNHGDPRDEAGDNDAKGVGINLTEDRFGNERHAYYFEGTYGSYLNLGTSSILKPPQGTISLWMKMDRIVYSGKGDETNPIILTKNRPADDFYEGYAIGVRFNRKIGVTASVDSANQIMVHSSNSLQLGEWYHVVLTYDNNFLSFYMNGKLEKRAIKNFASRFLLTDSVVVGYTANMKNQRYFNGVIDDIKIYNRVLSTDEIQSLYTSPNPNEYAAIIEQIALVCLILVGIGLIIWLSIRRYRKELKKQKEQNRIQSQMFEMEMHIIKAQMNPHFIFNAMNSVQQFILAGDMDNAHKYLGTFSKLLRKILESNDEEFISLHHEMDLVNKYIEIELLRFEHTFSYEISADIEDTDKVKIPQMMIQPLVENAIWHGLLPKKIHGNLSVTFRRLSKKQLLCIVEDNGVGRHAIKPDKDSFISKRKSLGIKFINKRLELMSDTWRESYALKVEDKVDTDGNLAGTKVVITIPVITETNEHTHSSNY